MIFNKNLDHAINLQIFVDVSYDIRQIVKIWNLLFDTYTTVAQNKYPKIMKNL